MSFSSLVDTFNNLFFTNPINTHVKRIKSKQNISNKALMKKKIPPLLKNVMLKDILQINHSTNVAIDTNIKSE
jgi:hypothetical protein